MLEETLSVSLELPLNSISIRWLGPDTSAFAELAEFEITTHNGNQVGWNADRLLEVVGVFLGGLRVVAECGHEDWDAGGDTGSVGDLVRWRIDARNERSAVDSLALRVEEGVGLAGSLLLCEPAERSAVLCGAVLDVDVNLVTFLVDGRGIGI